MNGMEQIGKLLIVIGLIVVALGGVMLLFGKVPLIGKLPGDIIIRRKNFILYFPLATGILISLVITLLFWLLGRRP